MKKSTPKKSRTQTKPINVESAVQVIMAVAGDSLPVKSVLANPQHYGLNPQLVTEEVKAAVLKAEAKREREIAEWVRSVNTVVPKQDMAKSFKKNLHQPADVELIQGAKGITLSVKTPRKPATGAKERTTVFGHSATAVLRYMGKHGWKFDAAVLAMHTLGARLSDSTVRIQLNAGVKGLRGEPAPLTKAQAKALKEASK